MRKTILMIALTCCVICSMLVYKITSMTELRQVDVTAVGVSDITGSILCSGKIESSGESDIYTDQAIKVTSVEVSLGDRVEAGQLLFTAEAVENGVQELLEHELTQEDVISVFNDLIDNSYRSTKTTARYTPEDTVYTVVSPITGVVSAVNIVQDAVYNNTVACVTVMDPAALQVRASVSEELIKDVSLGMRCDVTGVGFNGTYTGTVTGIVPYARQIQTLSGTGETVVDILITLDATSDELMPGFSVNVNVIEETIEDAILVPYECIDQDEDGREYVYVVYDDCAYRRYIETGYELDDCVQVVSGLYADERVIRSPDGAMVHGERVEVLQNADA